MDYRESRPSLPPELDPRGRRHARRPGRKPRGGAILGVQLVAAALSFVILIGSGYAWASFNRFSSNLVHVTTGSTTPGIDGADQNILLLGDDSREGASPQALAAIGTEQNDGDNTDTIMLMHVPADGTKASIISFPRDSLVPAANGDQVKINSVYATGEGSTGDVGAGARALEQSVAKVTGLTVDHFVKVSMFGFYDISEAIDGIDVNLCAAQNASTEN
ncbi:MAG: Cell envelope-related function transcriptional attenuator common domain, partial [Frankiales bacterium]|nr:Cell envelope-related function transcriptional attenuator common domain [Frankiales bacterium]